MLFALSLIYSCFWVRANIILRLERRVNGNLDLHSLVIQRIFWEGHPYNELFGRASSSKTIVCFCFPSYLFFFSLYLSALIWIHWWADDFPQLRTIWLTVVTLFLLHVVNGFEIYFWSRFPWPIVSSRTETRGNPDRTSQDSEQWMRMLMNPLVIDHKNLSFAALLSLVSLLFSLRRALGSNLEVPSSVDAICSCQFW